jgi:hypothetical protein
LGMTYIDCSPSLEAGGWRLEGLAQGFHLWKQSDDWKSASINFYHDAWITKIYKNSNMCVFANISMVRFCWQYIDQYIVPCMLKLFKIPGNY